jgi:hypothetical protein
MGSQLRAPGYNCDGIGFTNRALMRKGFERCSLRFHTFRVEGPDQKDELARGRQSLGR